MYKRDFTSAAVDNMLRLAMSGALIAAVLLAPNAIQALDKPLQKYLKKLNARDRQREISRVFSYMKHRQLISDEYEHGLVVTKKGLARLQKRDFDQLSIAAQRKWDRRWRLVFFDIPESHKHGRDALTSKLRNLGFRPLQRSVWIYPFPCYDEIVIVCDAFGVRQFVSYIETVHIDNEAVLKRQFKHLF